MNKQALEKTENAIKNEQSTYTDNIGHYTQIEDKQNRKQIQKVKKMCNTDPTKKLGVNTSAREG